MLRRFSHVALGFVLGLTTTATAGYRPVDSAAALLGVAHGQVAQLGALSAGVREHDVRGRLQVTTQALERTLFDLQILVDQTAASPPPPPMRPARPVPVVVQAVPAGDFAGILGAVNAQAFSDDKLAVLRVAIQGRMFTVSQVAQVMGAFAFGDDKVEVARMLRPLTVDPWAWYELAGHVTFSSEKQAILALG